MHRPGDIAGTRVLTTPSGFPTTAEAATLQPLLLSVKRLVEHNLRKPPDVTTAKYRPHFGVVHPEPLGRITRSAALVAGGPDE